MKISIHQPQFLPWLGYFEKISKSNIFVFLDNVQFKKNEWQNRNRIKTVENWNWITLPVNYEFGQLINEVKIHYGYDWKRKHLNSLKTNYSKAPYFDDIYKIIEKIYQIEWVFMSDLNIYLIREISNYLGISDIQFVKASDYNFKEGQSERLLDICSYFGANSYLSGRDGANYLDVEIFDNAKIKIEYQNYIHPTYSQLFGKFEPYMSIIDLLFNVGNKSLQILKN